jgi:AcrR family transcriptional regulator
MKNSHLKLGGYHHGDLRPALIRTGLDLLKDREADDLGLREVARAAGVSATAVYRHFPDKDALLQALAAEGLKQLGQAQQAAADAAGSGDASFRATGRAYVTFALTNPALFRLIFSRAKQATGRELHSKEDEASKLLTSFAIAMAGENDAEGARLIAIQSWALVHGLAVLILDKRLPHDPDLIEGVIEKGAPRGLASRYK